MPCPRLKEKERLFEETVEERERLVGVGTAEAAEFIAEVAEGTASAASASFSDFSDSKPGRWLDARLSAEPEQADVVHDLLVEGWNR